MRVFQNHKGDALVPFSEPRTQRSGVSGLAFHHLLRCAACAARKKDTKTGIDDLQSIVITFGGKWESKEPISVKN